MLRKVKMEKSKKIKTLKIIIGIIALALIVGIIIYLTPLIMKISTEEGRKNFKNEIDSLGIWGMLPLLGLQLAQILLIIIPGEPLEILAGMCYGSIGGAVFITVTVFITTILIFFLVRKFGKKFVYEFFNKEKIDKIERSKIFKNPKIIEYVMMILFLIPGTPKDLLVYIGGLLPIKPVRFILISTFARFPSVISSTIAGDNIIEGNIQTIVITYSITLLISLLIIYLSNKFDKHKIAKKALDTIK